MSDSDSLAQYSSTGHRLSNSAFIEAHYAVCRESYEAMLRSVNLQPGWHVLDAGCGSGSFLPLIGALVGPNGKISAFDIDPENIELVNKVAQDLDVPVESQIGSLTDLPYADNTFDAIWNANVIQYMSGSELALMLKEFVRVVKPGGLVAIKESDFTTLQFYPLDRFVFWHYLEIATQKQPGLLTVPSLPRCLKNAGLAEVKYATFLEEIHAPLPNYAHAFMAGALQFFAKEAENFQLSEADLEQWQRCRDPNAPDNPVNHPDFYYREGCALVIGKKASAY